MTKSEIAKSGSERKGRIASIDAAKGVLLIVVLISHGCGFLKHGDWFCACYMCAFFVLSGYTSGRIAADAGAGLPFRAARTAPVEHRHRVCRRLFHAFGVSLPGMGKQTA